MFGLVLVPLWFRLKVRGRDRIPRRGPVVLAANHVSFLDPVILQAACPRPVSYLMTDVFYRLRWAGWFFRIMRCIPVRERDGNSLREALQALEDGRALGIFPEGGISPDGTLQRGQAGVGTLAIRGRVPVVPVILRGTDLVLPHGKWFPRPGRLEGVFGEPLRFGDGEPSRAEAREAAAAVMRAIARLAESD